MTPRHAISLLCAILVTTACAQKESAQTMTDTSKAQSKADTLLFRVEALALVETLNADLLSHDSATQTLQNWCAAHHLAEPAKIVAQRDADAEAKPLPDDLREKLVVDSSEPITYRHVRLICGTHVLSEADNWYVPSRLSPQMNDALNNTDTPFGLVVAPLHFQRHTFAADVLFSPLPPGWEISPPADAAAPLRIPREVLRHQAILYSSGRMPFSAVVETYTNELFDFGEWAARKDLQAQP